MVLIWKLNGLYTLLTRWSVIGTFKVFKCHWNRNLDLYGCCLSMHLAECQIIFFFKFVSHSVGFYTNFNFNYHMSDIKTLGKIKRIDLFHDKKSFIFYPCTVTNDCQQWLFGKLYNPLPITSCIIINTLCYGNNRFGKNVFICMKPNNLHIFYPTQHFFLTIMYIFVFSMIFLLL